MKSILAIILIFLFPALTFAQCIKDSHSSFEGQGWVSCTKTLSDIPERGETHWLKYDFGHEYGITSMDLWNHNTWGQTQAGVKTIMIDYSLDENTWSSVGPISIDRAPGSWKYTGMQDIDLGKIRCRYMIITVVENWDESVNCTGIAEVRFDVDLSINTEEEIEEFANALLYPNPSSNMITVEYERLHKATAISVINTVGQIVLEVPVTNTNKIAVPLTDLDNGLYYLSLTTDTETITKTFVKQ